MVLKTVVVHIKGGAINLFVAFKEPTSLCFDNTIRVWRSISTAVLSDFENGYLEEAQFQSSTYQKLHINNRYRTK